MSSDVGLFRNEEKIREVEMVNSHGIVGIRGIDRIKNEDAKKIVV